MIFCVKSFDSKLINKSILCAHVHPYEPNMQKRTLHRYVNCAWFNVIFEHYYFSYETFELKTKESDECKVHVYKLDESLDHHNKTE